MMVSSWGHLCGATAGCPLAFEIESVLLAGVVPIALTSLPLNGQQLFAGAAWLKTESCLRLVSCVVWGMRKPSVLTILQHDPDPQNTIS